jgi:hypothetical protein
MFVRWRNNKVGIAWYLRKLDADGKFFGDVTDINRMQQRNFSGNMALAEVSTIIALQKELKKLKVNYSTNEDALFIGVIGASVNAKEFQGNWNDWGEIPVAFRGQIEIINLRISQSLLLSPTDKADTWGSILTKH